MWISKGLGIYLKTWKWSPMAPKGPFLGKTSWSNKSLKGTSYYQYPAWTFNFWIGRRMFCLSRNAA